MTSTKLTTVKKDMCICGDDMREKDPEEKMTDITNEIHSLFRGYVNAFHCHRDKHWDLEQQLKETQEQLDRAVEVIEFYANKGNWCGYHKNREEINPDDSERFSHDHWGYETVGGKKAREFIKGMGYK